MDIGDARARLERDQRFIEAHGGQEWTAAYIQPFYMTMQGEGGYREEADSLIPLLRARAFELSLDDISEMVTMQWRIQAAGAWYAIARADTSLSAAVHNGFQFCFGSLTAPSLAVAVLTYPSSGTREVLRDYLDRDIAGQYGSSGIITAALRRLDPSPIHGARTPHDDHLEELLARAARAQSG